MRRVYLAPSMQSFNQTALGVNEQVLMSMITDAIEPLLRLNNISYIRAREGMTTQQMIDEANANNMNAYVGIRSNTSPTPGAAFGNRNYFWHSSSRGRALAQSMADEFSKIYYDPSRAAIVPNNTQEELRRTRMPAVNIFTAFHDNLTDARWIQSNIQSIAQAIVRALVAYFGQTYIAPCSMGTHGVVNNYMAGRLEWAVVCTAQTALNIRRSPNGDVVFTLPRNSQVVVIGGPQDGFVKIRYNFWEGWASAEFICLCDTGKPIQPPVAPIPPIGTLPPVSPVPPIGEIPPTMARMAHVRTQGSNLNMRSGPGLTFPVISQMPNGARILVLRQVGDWYQVFWNGQLGWAHSNYVVLES